MSDHGLFRQNRVLHRAWTFMNGPIRWLYVIPMLVWFIGGDQGWWWWPRLVNSTKLNLVLVVLLTWIPLMLICVGAFFVHRIWFGEPVPSPDIPADARSDTAGESASA